MAAEILDEAGNELLYWPLGALKSGDTSQTIKIQVKCGPGRELACSEDSSVRVLARRDGVGDYVDISLTPISLSGLGSGFSMFQIHLFASVEIEAAARVPLFVGPVGQGSVNWTG
jgi:hypothetical protein